MIRILLFVLFAGLSTLMQAQEPLIPRELLFQAKEKTGIQLAKSGQQVFYQKSEGDPHTIYFVGMPNLRKEQSVRFDTPVLDWVCTYNDGLLVILENGGSQKMAFWSNKTEETRDVPLLDSAVYQIVDMSPRLKNKIAIKGRSLKDEQSGIYLIDLYGKSVTKKILEEEGFSGIRFDYMFNPVAAWRRNEQSGNSIFLRKGHDWTPIAEFPFDESQFLGGFQQVVSVTGDGTAIYYTDNQDRDKTVLIKYDIASGSKAVVAEDDQADILPFGAIINKKGVPGLVLGVFAKAKRYYPDPSFEKDFNWIDKELMGQASLAASSANDSTWLVRKLDGGP
ncbi:MAG: hypothetical protein KDC44_10405, partial [Phaeodactylibacter sp.]|nr:hypothetical protein [Phaeodactylibacter sp.]